MDDTRLTSSPSAPAASPTASLARVSFLPWALFLIALASAVFFAWKWWQPEDLGDPLATSLVAFEKQDKLTVFSAELAPVVSSNDSRMFGLVNSKQVAVIPARIDYTIDLSKVGRERLNWDAQTQTLGVKLPTLTVSRPNLDEARAQYLRDGIWITREAQDKLTRDNTRLAEAQAVQQAANPVLMNLARQAAKEAISQNLSIPLQVAGYGKAKVVVTFDP
ncbi:MAG: DUF4230 domain-containing protein [Novosphingobium sp.]|uniref:DUF4230 domain-containing protein n=1 Tax=Novosphingobium sp. TaxID=1874826 RepID=UPI003B9C6ACE